MNLLEQLREINRRPEVFQFYTAEELWTDEHISKQMLQYHLNETVDAASRNTAFIDRSAEWIATHFNIDDETSIIDFGCGPGLYTSRLAERGAAVTGIDFSENSLRYARGQAAGKGLNIDYIRHNYLDFTTSKRFDTIIMIMCDFCALSSEQRKNLLSTFRSILKPGGSLLLDVYSMKYFEQKLDSASYEFNHMNGFWSADDYYCFVNTFTYPEEKVILDKYTIIEESRTRAVYNWLQCYSRESLTQEFAQSGFGIRAFFSDVAGSAFSKQSSEFAVVAAPNGNK